jgi:RND family efflux transporter MFP subunit
LKRALVVIVIVVIMVVGASILVKNAKAQKAAELEAAQVEPQIAVQIQHATRADIRQELTITGSVEADADSNVTSKIVGKITHVRVDEGARVHKGQPLIELERADLAAQLRQSTAAVAAAQARLKQAQKSIGLQETQTSTGIESAHAALASARARLQQAQTAAEVTSTQTTTSVEQAQQALNAANAHLDILTEGARTQQIAQADEAVAQAKAGLGNARTNLDRARKLLAQGAMAQQQYDAAKLQFDVAQAQYNSALQQQDLVREGARSQEIDIARTTVEQARAALTLAQANRAQNRIVQKDVEAAQEGVRTAEANLRMAQASSARDDISHQDVQAAKAALEQARAGVLYTRVQIGYTTIRAPMSGIVTRRYVDPGEAASPGLPLLTITDNGSVFVRGNLPETEINNVQIGRQVTVTIDALPEQLFDAEIIEIIPSADTKSRTFDMKARIINPQNRVKQGMFGRVVVLVAAADNAIVIPRHAVLQQEDRQVVYLADGDRAKRVDVTTGLNDADDVVITHGIKEGDPVIVSGQTLLEPGKSIRLVENAGENAK